MEEYKSWHEEDGITFHNQMNIFFSQCDKFKRLSLHELLRITSDTAVEEYRQRGLSRDVLTQNGYAILVSRVSFKINRMPKENEHITITTWEEKPEALQFVRAYRIKDKDGKLWHVAFTSHSEYKKGEPSEIISNFIDSTLKSSLEMDIAGFVINPWGQSFMLSKDLIRMIIEADGGVEYSVPHDPITPELLEGGTYLKRAIEICNRNRTQLNLIKLARILRDSWVWIPCNAILSDADNETIEKAINDANDGEGLDSLIGQTFTAHDAIRMVPDILQNGDDFYFPVFSSEEEMGEYGENFSKVARHFLDAAVLARNNERNVKGIVINAFTEPFVVPREMFDFIANM